MRIVITGGAGFLGRRLAQALLRRGRLIGPDGSPQAITDLVLFDQVAAAPLNDARVSVRTGDIADAAAVAALISPGTASVFHLAAVVSAGAEADFDLGYRVNLDGTRQVLQACRALAGQPRLVFTSSIAIYGGSLPDQVSEAIPPRPQTSYGAQKAAGELMVADYSRKGFLDGRSVRLPTITIRPGKPNRAASTWASSIMREPLSGLDVVCPVRPDSRMACLSPRRCIQSLIRLHDLPATDLAADRTLQLPGLSVSAQEMAAAVERHAGNRRLGRILWQPDPEIQRIVDGWPKGTFSERSTALGFAGDRHIDDIVQAFIEDDLDQGAAAPA